MAQSVDPGAEVPDSFHSVVNVIILGGGRGIGGAGQHVGKNGRDPNAYAVRGGCVVAIAILAYETTKRHFLPDAGYGEG